MGSRADCLAAKGTVMKRKVLALQQLASDKTQQEVHGFSGASLLLCYGH